MISRNIFSLARKARLASKLTRSFGGAAHHDDHGHGHGHDNHGYEVHLERNKNLISNTSFNGDFIALNGFTDAHSHHHHDETDPFAHVRNAPLVSFERMFFADPYYHDDGHEPLMNEPHGYLTNDDPMDTRPNIEKSTMELLFIGSIAVILALTFGFQRLNFKNPAESLFTMTTAADEIEDKIREIRISNEKLETEKAELEAKLASL